MVAKVPPKDLNLTIKFGGGLHTRASADEIDAREASSGQNFQLDLENRELRNRKPFDLIGAPPRTAAPILGGASLLKSDGTISTLFQCGDQVFEWKGGSTFAFVGSCSAAARLRGHWRSHNWTLGDKVIITDLSGVETVKEWDGTTYKSTEFNGGTFGSFYAKYVSVSNERAVFANVRDSGLSIPHMMIGSERGDYTNISVSDRPSSSLSAADPYFLLAPDLKPINGLQEAFGATVISTEKGRLFNLTGSSAQDFKVDEFFAGSAASGPESLAYIGNDLVYGRQGRIESVRDTNTFGNTESDNLSAGISDLVGNYPGWTTVFNGRLNRAYFFPAGQSECWAFNTAFRTSRQLSANALNQFVFQSQVQKESGSLSPWMRWKTSHSLAFMPTFAMSMLDPTDGLEYVFMGDASGNIYRMEGTGQGGDGGAAPVVTEWLSKVFSAPLDSEAFDVEGWIKYKRNTATTVTLTFLASGRTVFDNTITVSLPAISGVNYFGGDAYFGGEYYFGVPFSQRLVRQPINVPGQMSDFQVKVSVTGNEDFSINEIGIRFKAASQ